MSSAPRPAATCLKSVAGTSFHLVQTRDLRTDPRHCRPGTEGTCHNCSGRIFRAVRVRRFPYTRRRAIVSVPAVSEISLGVVMKAVQVLSHGRPCEVISVGEV